MFFLGIALIFLLKRARWGTPKESNGGNVPLPSDGALPPGIPAGEESTSPHHAAPIPLGRRAMQARRKIPARAGRSRRRKNGYPTVAPLRTDEMTSPGTGCGPLYRLPPYASFPEDRTPASPSRTCKPLISFMPQYPCAGRHHIPSGGNPAKQRHKRRFLPLGHPSREGASLLALLLFSRPCRRKAALARKASLTRTAFLLLTAA